MAIIVPGSLCFLTSCTNQKPTTKTFSLTGFFGQASSEPTPYDPAEPGFSPTTISNQGIRLTRTYIANLFLSGALVIQKRSFA